MGYIILGWMGFIVFYWTIKNKPLFKPKEKLVVRRNHTAGYEIYEDGMINVYNKLRFKKHFGKY